MLTHDKNLLKNCGERSHALRRFAWSIRMAALQSQFDDCPTSSLPPIRFRRLCLRRSDRRRHHVFHRRDVQSLAVRRPLSRGLQKRRLSLRSWRNRDLTLPTPVSSYRPISNLPVLSKLLERLVVRQLMGYLSSADRLRFYRRYNLFPPGTLDWNRCSAVAVGHATGRRPWWYSRPDPSGFISGLIRSTIAVLLQWMQTTFGIDDSAHRRFQFYLSGRHQYVRRGSARSTIVYLICGLPQGSVLGQWD